MIFFICTTPRTGSHLLMSLLNSTGYCGKIEELLARWQWEKYTNFPYSERYDVPDGAICEFFRNIIKQKGSKAGVFGGKIHIHELPVVQRYMELQGITIADVKWIWLQRNDKIRQAISYLKAQQIHQFGLLEGKSRANEDGIQISLAKVRDTFVQFHVAELKWQDFFESNAICPIHVTYEDLAQNDYEVFIHLLLRGLNIAHELPLKVSTPYRKQSTDFNEALYQQFIKRYL